MKPKPISHNEVARAMAAYQLTGHLIQKLPTEPNPVRTCAGDWELSPYEDALWPTRAS